MNRKLTQQEIKSSLHQYPPIVEEAHRFTKKRVAEDAKTSGEQAEIALDRLIREARKFGISVNVPSQRWFL